MNLKEKYTKYETIQEIVWKNKENILFLLPHLLDQSVVKKLEDLAQSTDDKLTTFITELFANSQQTTENEVEIENLINNLNALARKVNGLSKVGGFFGKFDTFTDLQNTTLTPESGFIAEVGTSAPYSLYVYDGSAWVQTSSNSSGVVDLTGDYDKNAIDGLLTPINSEITSLKEKTSTLEPTSGNANILAKGQWKFENKPTNNADETFATNKELTDAIGAIDLTGKQDTLTTIDLAYTDEDGATGTISVIDPTSL